MLVDHSLAKPVSESAVLAGIARKPLSHDVASAIRSAILNGHWQPGQRITESSLAEQLDVSRGPVREALAQLELEGIVARVPHRGTFVTTLSRRDAQELYTLRALLDGEAAALAAPHMTADEFALLEQHLAAFATVEQTHDIARLAEVDRLFHDAVIHASHQRRLAQVCVGLTALISACYLTVLTAVPRRRAGVAQRHAVLVQALRTRDPDIARQAFSQHYLDSWADLARALPEDPAAPRAESPVPS